MTVVRYSAEAKREHDDAALHYDKQQRGLGHRFVEAVDDAINRLKSEPTSWPILVEEYRRCPVTGFPYDLIFLPRESTILIVAVAHHRRRPAYWRGRTTSEEMP